MNQDIQYLIFHYIIQHPDLTAKCKKNYFQLDYLSVLFDILKDQIIRFQKPITNAESAINLVNFEGTPEIKAFLTPDIIRAIFSRANDLSSFDEEFIENWTKAFLSWQTLIDGVTETAAYIKTVQYDVSAENYQQLVETAKMKLTKGTTVEFSTSGNGISFYDAQNHITKDLLRWSTGYDFLDRCTKGGYWAGSLWVFLGAPKAGKSRLLQNLCAEAVKKGHNCFYASFELQEEIIIQRMGANLLDINMDDYDTVAKDAHTINQKLFQFQNPMFGCKPGFLDIKAFPTSAYSVMELEQFLLKEEERISIETGQEFHFKNIYVDYINIMKNWRNPNSENTYMKIKQIAEDLRAIAMKHGWCIITVTQVKQSFFNAADMDMTSASESSALGATVDFMGGIITDVLLQASHALYLKSILSRVSPHINERKKFDIDEPHMRLIETEEAIIHDEDIMETFAEKGKRIISSHNASYANIPSSTMSSTDGPTLSNDMVVNPVGKTVYVSPNLNIDSVNLSTGEGLGF